MLRYGFFDSEITGYDEEGMPVFDRAESSDFLAMFISRIISDGVLGQPGDCFQVVSGEGMRLKVKPGFGIIKGRFAMDKQEAEVTVPKAPTAYKRIDRVILRANYLQRMCEIVIKEGDSGMNPVPPELTRPASGDFYELCLATVAVNSNQTVITQANITDTRYDSRVCGVVTQVIDHLDTSVFFAQLDAFYKEFVDKSNESYDLFREMAQAAYEDITGRMEDYFSGLSSRGEERYEEFNADINAYIEALQAKGNSDLATITQQLLDFKNENQAAFLEWFENVKEMLGTDPAGKLQNQINGLISRIDDLSGMLYSGMMLADLITDDGDLITDDAGNVIVVDWPICGCQKNSAQGGC